MKTFNIFKTKQKKNDKSPDYNISIKDGDRYLNIGGCWLKEGKDGQKYFSCKLSDGYKDVMGFSIERDEEFIKKEFNSSLTDDEKQILQDYRKREQPPSQEISNDSKTEIPFK